MDTIQNVLLSDQACCRYLIFDAIFSNDTNSEITICSMFSFVRAALNYFWTLTERDFGAGHTSLFLNCFCFSLFCYFCHFRWQDGCYSKDKAVFRFRYRRDAVVRRFATTRHGDKISDVSAARETTVYSTQFFILKYITHRV